MSFGVGSKGIATPIGLAPDLPFLLDLSSILSKVSLFIFF